MSILALLGSQWLSCWTETGTQLDGNWDAARDGNWDAASIHGADTLAASQFPSLGISLHPFVTGSATTLVVSRLQSSLRVSLRTHVTARELASSPFEDVYIRACANPGHPESASNMTTWGKQSIPTTGLSPASPTALWAAEPALTPRSRPKDLSIREYLATARDSSRYEVPAIPSSDCMMDADP